MAVKERILLVEDDAFIREGVTALLVQEGYEVEDCSSLAEARRALEEEEPSLLILDVLLPDGSSFDLCGEIRQQWEAPILFLTCCDQDEDMVRGLDAGGDDYVAKPFRGRVLLSRVRALLRRSRRERGQLRSPWFELDQERQLCRVEGKTLALTPTEYRLLYTLAKAADMVVSRENLLRAVWELGGEFLDENTLAVHISRLRGKLGIYSGQLETVRGEGYRLRWENE